MSFHRQGLRNGRLFSSSASENLPAKQEENLPALVPIDFDAASRISGEESQIVEVTLRPNQVLRAESGAMLYMTKGIHMETSMGGGGMSSGFKRMLTGQNLMVSDYSFKGENGSGVVALGTDFPSKILRLNLQDYDGKIVCQKSAYLAGSHTVDIELAFAKKFTTGFFGGEGFVLQSLTGEGEVLVKAGGTLVKRELKTGETLRVSSGCLVAFTKDVEYDVQMMPGFKNVLFGGEGLFVTTLTGPGIVWLQGMPPDRMISEIIRRVGPAGGGLGIPIPMGGGGGAAGDAGTEGEAEPGAEGAEDMVAATDAAVDADRNATVASSGLYGDDASISSSTDGDSPSALFGDAAPEGESPVDSASGSSSSSPFDDESTSFSTNDSTFDEPKTDDPFDDFEQDQTSFSSSGDEQTPQQDDTDTDMGGSGDDDDEGGGFGSVVSSLWDFFTKDDD
eukprot:scaffold255492_cov44-Attheya_sp.AAC.2